MGVAAAISKRGMSNTSDCSYLRKWAVCMNVVIFSFQNKEEKHWEQKKYWEQNDWYLPEL